MKDNGWRVDSTSSQEDVAKAAPSFEEGKDTMLTQTQVNMAKRFAEEAQTALENAEASGMSFEQLRPFVAAAKNALFAYDTVKSLVSK